VVVTCSAERWEYVGKIMRGALSEDAQPCGVTYDDRSRSTICPHKRIDGMDDLVCKETDLYTSVCPHCAKKKESQ
jgi:hypothetical protein